METNPYDITVPWTPQQNQWTEDRYISARNSQQRPSVLETSMQQLRDGDQKLKLAGRMTKAEALALLNKFKHWLVIASLIAFGVLSGLVAHQQANTAVRQLPTDPSQALPDAPSSSGGFFDQQGGNQFGSNHDWQRPVTGSSVS